MNPATILSIIDMAATLVKGLTALVDNATDVLSQEDAEQVRIKANELAAENDRLTQVVLAKLG